MTVRGGCYHLVIRLQRAFEAPIGRLGRHRFPAGWYVYTGSARAGLDARINRHLRRGKPLHWHIDYLLASPAARIVQVVKLTDARLTECGLNRTIGKLPGARVIVPGFGASDCRASCPAHLYYFRTRPSLNASGPRSNITNLEKPRCPS